jgi:hypothetical protein
MAPGGYVYHALNRPVARLPLFEKEGDFAAFERVLSEALAELGKEKGTRTVLWKKETRRVARMYRDCQPRRWRRPASTGMQ